MGKRIFLPLAARCIMTPPGKKRNSLLVFLGATLSPCGLLPLSQQCREGFVLYKEREDPFRTSLPFFFLSYLLTVYFLVLNDGVEPATFMIDFFFPLLSAACLS